MASPSFSPDPGHSGCRVPAISLSSAVPPARGDEGGIHTLSLSLLLVPLLPQASLPQWGRKVRGTDQCPGSWGPLPARPPPRASGGGAPNRASFPSSVLRASAHY